MNESASLAARSGAAVSSVSRVSAVSRAGHIAPPLPLWPGTHEFRSWPRPDVSRIPLFDIERFDELVYGVGGRTAQQAAHSAVNGHSRAEPEITLLANSPPADRIVATLRLLRGNNEL